MSPIVPTRTVSAITSVETPSSAASAGFGRMRISGRFKGAVDIAFTRVGMPAISRCSFAAVSTTTPWSDPLTINCMTYFIDCLWLNEQIAVELDGRDAHERALAFEADRRRDAALTAIGLRPMRFTWQRVNYDGAEALADLTAAMKRSSLTWSR